MRALLQALPNGESQYEDSPAVGEDSILLRRHFENLITDYYKPISRQWANPGIRFQELREEWKENTAVLSSITEIAMHPAYQQIIGMGPVAVQFIMQEMLREQDHWFWALRSIAGEDPVPPEHRGRMEEMTGAWLSWGQRQGYLP